MSDHTFCFIVMLIYQPAQAMKTKVKIHSDEIFLLTSALILFRGVSEAALMCFPNTRLAVAQWRRVCIVKTEKHAHQTHTHTNMYAGSLTRCFANIVSTVMLIEQTEVKI